MSKLVSVAVIGVALAAMGCQEQARPPQTPAAQAAATPPPPGGRPDMGPGRPGGPGGPGGPGAGPWGQPRREGARGPHDGTGPHAGRHDRRGERMAEGPGPRGPGERMGHKRRAKHPMGPMGPMGHGAPGAHGAMGPGARGPEVMRELAMLGVRFYPPQLLIRRAKDVGLTPEQVNKVRDEMLATRKRAIDLHAKAEHAKLEAARLLAADKVDERAVGAQIDEAAKAHAELHKVHVASMVRVRAMLTPEQRQKLDEKKPRPPGGPRPGMGPVGQADDDADDDDADDDDDDDDGDAAG